MEASTTTNHPETCSRTDQVLDHYDTVYDTYYSYDLDEWMYERTEHAEGNDRNPYWPEYSVHLNGQQVLGAERVSGTPESYVVYFETNEKDEIEVYTYSTTESEWNQYIEGEIYTLKINHFNAVMNNPLQDKINLALTDQPK